MGYSKAGTRVLCLILAAGVLFTGLTGPAVWAVISGFLGIALLLAGVGDLINWGKIAEGISDLLEIFD